MRVGASEGINGSSSSFRRCLFLKLSDGCCRVISRLVSRIFPLPFLFFSFFFLASDFL